MSAEKYRYSSSGRQMRREYGASHMVVNSLGLLAVFVVLFSDVFNAPFGGYADQRLVLSITSGLLTLVFAVFSANYFPVKLGSGIKVFFPSLVLSLSFLLLSIPFLDHPYALVEPGMYAFFFLSAVAAGAMLSWQDSATGFPCFLVLTVAASCALYGLSSINVYLFAVFDGVTDLVDFIPWGFVNIRYWSHIATWCLPLIPLAVMTGPLKTNRMWHAFVLVGAGLWWWILLLTTGRGSALGIAFGMILTMLLFGRKALPWLRLSLVYLFAGVIIWLLLSVIIPSFMADGVQVRSIKADSSGRMPLFIEAWAMSMQNFPFGMGPQSWLTHETLTENYANSKKFGHPHNMYLMWAAEYGWILLAALGLVVVQAISYFWAKRRQVLAGESTDHMFLLAGFTASVSAAMFHAGVSAVFMAPGSMLVGLFVLIAFWALIIPDRCAPEAENGTMPSLRNRTIAAIFASVLVLGVWFAWMKEVVIYYRDMRHDEVNAYESVGEGILPRFWFHGNFPRRDTLSGPSE